jgi:hypothetical protein
MRTFLAYFNLVNFLVMVFVTFYVLYSFWGELQGWWLAVYSYYVILGCSGVVIALWLALDGKRLESYSNKIRSLEKKLIEVEKIIKWIKRKPAN